MTRIILAAGAVGLWVGLVLAMVGRLTDADIHAYGIGYVVGALAGAVLAYGVGRLVTKRR